MKPGDYVRLPANGKRHLVRDAEHAWCGRSLKGAVEDPSDLIRPPRLCRTCQHAATRRRAA